MQQSELIPPELGTNFIAGLLNVYKTNAIILFGLSTTTREISYLPVNY
ncbi:MAG: hypothetical protein AAFW70_04850 [Cyanobacteria bacterium J06635_10]